MIAVLKSYPMFRAIDPQGINLRVLEDLGLIKEQPLNTQFALGDFRIGIPGRPQIMGDSLYGLWVLTFRGAEIASAVFRARKLELSEDLKLAYLTKFVEEQFPLLRSVEVNFTHDKQTTTLAILRGEQVGWPAGMRPNSIPPLLARLLEWVESRFVIKIVSQS